MGPIKDENSIKKLSAYRLPHFPGYMKLVAAPADRMWMDLSTRGWANRCLPLRIANQSGWHILNDCAFEAVWEGAPELSSVKITFKNEKNPYIQSAFGFGTVTWYVPYLFRTPPGYNLLARGPANEPKNGIAPLEGVVETDWAVASFSMSWKFTKPFQKVTFDKDEPICLIVPVKRHELESFEPEINNLSGDLLAEYSAWLESRKALVEQKAQNVAPKSMEGHYIRGETVRGTRVDFHQNKLDLQEFTEHDSPLPSTVKYERVIDAKKGIISRILGK